MTTLHSFLGLPEPRPFEGVQPLIRKFDPPPSYPPPPIPTFASKEYEALWGTRTDLKSLLYSLKRDDDIIDYREIR